MGIESWIDKAIEEELTLKHIKLMTLLVDQSNHSTYIRVASNQTDISVRYIERAIETRPSIFKPTTMPKLYTHASSRPREAAIKLTNKGVRLAKRVLETR